MVVVEVSGLNLKIEIYMHSLVMGPCSHDFLVMSYIYV